MKVKTFVLYAIICILVVTTIIVFSHSKISGSAVIKKNTDITPGIPTPEKNRPKPIYPDGEMHILPVPSCKEGGRRCAGINLQGCIGGEWITISVCRPGTICTLNGCKAIQPGCRTGDRRCTGINLERCINGRWEVMATCKSGNYCTTDGCKPIRPNCPPGQRRCKGNNLQACIGDQWITTAVCGQDQYCSAQGCMTIPPAPSNIIIGMQGLACPTKPSINVPFPEPIYKENDCQIRPSDVEIYLKSLEKAVATCNQIQTQQLALAQADLQYVQYQISLLYPDPTFPPYQPTCNLFSPTPLAQQPSTFTPPQGKQRFTEWLNYITRTAKNYCTIVQSIIEPVIDGCTKVNANIPVCGTDYAAQTTYFNYLNSQMALSSDMARRATALSATFTFNVNQLKSEISKTGIPC